MASPLNVPNPLRPAAYGAWGKQPGLDKGGLADFMCDSRCPPVITQDTIIIAVCGPNDYMNNASPGGHSVGSDGWFFSDFFLFHHLLQHTAKKQHWLCCVEPKQLVDKYGEYLHGDPKGDRRVVLDKQMLGSVSDVLVFDPNMLLERFLAYVTEACRNTKGTNQPILLMTFGHGDRHTTAITIGGAGVYDKCTVLTQQKLREALYRWNPSPNVALLTTSCYGGGWAQATFLNISAMAGADDENELLSWPESQTTGRFCSSRYATGVVTALIRNELGLEIQSEECEHLRASPTYAALTAAVSKIMTEEIDIRPTSSRFSTSSQVSFSAKDDLWATEWRQRTGFPLATYQVRWNMLRQVQSSGLDNSAISIAGSVRLSDTVAVLPAQAAHELKWLVRKYLESCPGDDSAAKNLALHSLIRQLLQGRLTDKPKAMEVLAYSLQYRLSLMHQATSYKNFLRIDFQDCEDISSGELFAIVKSKPQGKLMLRKADDITARQLFFERPTAIEGLPYEKPSLYLSCVLAQTGWSEEKIRSAVQELAKYRDWRSSFNELATWRSVRGDRTIREKLADLAKQTGRRIRELSPVKGPSSPKKHPRKSLEGLFRAPT